MSWLHCFKKSPRRPEACQPALYPGFLLESDLPPLAYRHWLRWRQPFLFWTYVSLHPVLSHPGQELNLLSTMERAAVLTAVMIHSTRGYGTMAGATGKCCIHSQEAEARWAVMLEHYGMVPQAAGLSCSNPPNLGNSLQTCPESHFQDDSNSQQADVQDLSPHRPWDVSSCHSITRYLTHIPNKTDQPWTRSSKIVSQNSFFSL